MEGNDFPIHTAGTVPMDMLWNTSSSSAFITYKQLISFFLVVNNAIISAAT